MLGTALLIAALAPGAAFAQAGVEYGLGAARAAAGASVFRSLGKSIGALRGPAHPPASAPLAWSAPALAVVPGTACAEDPAKVAVGMKSAELLRRCGAPALETTGERGHVLLYVGREREVEVLIEAGAVAEIRERRKQPDGGVVVVQ